MRQGEPWGIYVHVPWCRRRCVYCSFYIEVGRARAGFAQRILTEFHARRSGWPRAGAVSLYLGGGTPSTLSVTQVRTLIVGMRSNGALSRGAEVTLEANPEDVEPVMLRRLACCGVTRLSLGVQSLQGDILRWLGRKHDPAQARRAIRWALEEGFAVSVDWIVGVPDEDPRACEWQVAWAAREGVRHMSVYLLTVEEGSNLHRSLRDSAAKGSGGIGTSRKVKDVDPDAQALVYERVQRALRRLGYEQYEVSNFARRGCASIHNRLYWAKGQYVGLGPGAHSMLLLSDGSVIREHTHAALAQWWGNPAGAPRTVEQLAQSEALCESLAFGLRDLQAGINPTALSQRHRVALPGALLPTLRRLQRCGWIRQRRQRWHVTSRGALFADAVARELLVAS